VKLLKQIEFLVSIVGTKCAIQSIVESDKIDIEDLLITQKQLGITVDCNTSKQTIVERLLGFVELHGFVEVPIVLPYTETCNEFNYIQLETYIRDLLSLTNICRVLDSIGFDDKIYIKQEHTRCHFSLVPINPHEILYEDSFISIERYYNFLSSGTPTVNIIFTKHGNGSLDANYFNEISRVEFFNSVNPRIVKLRDGTTFKSSDDIKSTMNRITSKVEYLYRIKPIVTYNLEETK